MLKKEEKIVKQELQTLSRQNIKRLTVQPKRKNIKEAKKAKLEGDKLFQLQKHDEIDHVEIWRKYTLCIALAPIGSKELACGYGNRSAIRYHISKFEDSIVDVNRAVSITKSSLLKAKWLCCKVKCLLALGNLENAKEVLVKAKSYIEKECDAIQVKDIIRKTEKLLKTKSSKENERTAIPSLTLLNSKIDDLSNVTDNRNSMFGRHLIATRDIAPGEIVFVKKLYCASIVHSNAPQKGNYLNYHL